MILLQFNFTLTYRKKTLFNFLDPLLCLSPPLLCKKYPPTMYKIFYYTIFLMNENIKKNAAGYFYKYFSPNI